MFDGMQYIGGSFVGLGMGYLLDRFGWGIWGPSMIGFAAIGAVISSGNHGSARFQAALRWISSRAAGNPADPAANSQE